MKRALVIGFGKSGKSAAKFLSALKYDVTVLDDKYHEEIPYKKISYRELKKQLQMFDLGIRSPGIKSTSALYKVCQILCKELISEIELGYRYLIRKNAKFIAVTGTNGKTTLVSMIYELIKSVYSNAHLLGNVGQPLTENILNIPFNAFIILEVSSFQLEDTYQFHPAVVVITNVGKNHLDHVISYDFYKASKKRIMQNLTKQDLIIYTQESKNLIDDKVRASVINIDENKTPYHLYDEIIYYKQQPFVHLNELLIKGKHNSRHVITALNIANYYFGYSKKYLEIVRGFKGIDYRMQEMGKMGNYFVINDGKSTNVMSTQATIDTYDKLPRIIILGGIAKSGTFSALKLKEEDVIFIYGKHAQSIRKELKRGEVYETLDEIMQQLLQDEIDRYLIFSPGCASFDQFENYIHRSKYFNQLVEGWSNVSK